MHISDLHCDPTKRLEDRLSAVAADLKPDLIVFTGDAVNSPSGLDNFHDCMKKLVAVAPVLAVRGNWEGFNNLDYFASAGVEELNGVAKPFKVGDNEIWIAGFAPYNSAVLPTLVKSVPPEKFLLLLHHYAREIHVASDLGVDLYLAGHTHGGQVALPFYGAIVTLAKYGKRFESGLYKQGNTHLYVSRGIGMEGGSAPRIRFFARPEVTMIEIVPEN